MINGSDWELESNWFYVEWCTGEREFYNMHRGSLSDEVDQVNPTLLKQLSTFSKMLVGCAGSSCVDIDFKDVALLYSRRGRRNESKSCLH